MHKRKGFTLIELMVTVAIMGILAAVAVPSYLNQVRGSRRADAEGVLSGFANAMERRYTLTNSYCDAGGAGGANSCGSSGTNDTGSPSVFPTQAPIDSDVKYYDLTISAIGTDGNSYTLLATPITGSDQANDKCGWLSLTSTGVKGQQYFDTETCWRS